MKTKRFSKLSILMPAYNEEKTISEIIALVDAVDLSSLGLKKELIVVDDGSKDRTVDIVKGLSKKYPYIRFIQHKKNKGKGGAIKTAIRHSTGEILIVQDADLEYDPNDYVKCLSPIVKGKAKVVYGSRFLDKNYTVKYKLNWLATNFLNLMVLLLFFQKLTDEPTCYKTFRADVIKKIKIVNDRFDWEPEVTAKLLKKGVRIHEVPIKYMPRSFEEGKKIGWKDGFQAIWTLLKYRVVD